MPANMPFKHVTLTGLPGVGKTTLIKKISTQLKENHVDTNGFYTEEIHDGHGNRIGFDVVTLDGKRGRLARSVNEVAPQQITKFKVGQYIVFPTEFEQLVLPLFEKKAQVLVIDEIGKMEMFSKKFKNTVQTCYKNNNTVLSTIPVKKTQIPVIEEVRSNPEVKLFTVDQRTRNSLDKEVLSDILKILKK